MLLHQIVPTQARIYPPAHAYLADRRVQGRTGREARRALKRLVVRRVFHARCSSIDLSRGRCMTLLTWELPVVAGEPIGRRKRLHRVVVEADCSRAPVRVESLAGRLTYADRRQHLDPLRLDPLVSADL